MSEGSPQEHVDARVLAYYGAGVHAAALAGRGDEVLLIDPVPRHVEAANAHGTFTAMRGDARSLPVDDHGFPGGHVHLADDLEQEALDAGLRDVRTVGLEGPGALALEVSRSHDPHLIAAARTLAEAYESQPGLRDLSPHLLTMGSTPAT